MTGLEIALLLVGVMFLVGSFFASEKLSTSDIETVKKMSEKEIALILEKELGTAQERLGRQLDEKLEDSVDAFDVQTDREVNRKILAIGEYADSIREDIDKSLESMGKTHDEIVFMYDRLNDKQENITRMTRELQTMESAVRLLDDSISDKITKLHQEEEILSKAMQQRASAEPEGRESVEEALAEKIREEQIKEETAGEDGDQEKDPKEDAAAGESGETLRPENTREEILALSQQGYSEIEIARRLGRGLGEVKLVLGLFNEVRES